MAELPLNDPRWTPMHVSIEKRKRRTGDLGLALLDTERLAASDKVRTMRRNRRTGEAKPVEASDWKDYFIGHVSPTSVIIYRQTDPDRHKTDEYGNLVAEPLVDWLFYEWQPDIDGLNSADAGRRPEKRKASGGAPRKFTAQQQQWLQNKYGRGLKAEPRLAKHEGAVEYVRGLAKTKYDIDAGRNTLLEHIIRPVLRAAKNNQ
ncbi:hypothetical protein ACH79_06400 [Bradyrhizobium sp. CCBAU 051011]|uniref:hypothetical protein n=1 Tax=Bradyrhizobium sp. CCBAU 051011 TaxID=858422 RepID=UPI001373BDAF|nr:hypothetical protein [Bradyrhizobium sp. CCBAU 051011]QHO72311.1 hypothetical protein ACH79_06400 [Bradyrhizobium sp. CCBAU 051011]